MLSLLSVSLPGIKLHKIRVITVYFGFVIYIDVIYLTIIAHNRGKGNKSRIRINLKYSKLICIW